MNGEQVDKSSSDGFEDEDNPPAKDSETGNELKITVDSNGLPQISTGTTAEGTQQDAMLLGGQSLPPRPSSEHASDHDFKAPLPKSVREDLLNNSKANTATSTNVQVTRKKSFSLLVAFCRNPDLLLTLTSYLTLPSLISLYAISKTFHYVFNRHHTAFILSSMRTWAPGADAIYPWRCYRSLCTNDPQLRQKMKWMGLEPEEAVWRLGVRGRDLRDVPTLRWLQMVVWREGVCRDVLLCLATRGLRCPVGTLDAVKVGLSSFLPHSHIAIC